MSNAITHHRWHVGDTLRDELVAELAYLRWVLQQSGLPIEVRSVTEQRRLNVNRALAALPTCAHTLTANARVDGLYDAAMFGEPKASVTCGECKSSVVTAVRPDFAERVLGGVV